jgi:NADH-quinone oxidoreductase subunit C
MNIDELKKLIETDFPETKIDVKNEQYLQVEIDEAKAINLLNISKNKYGFIHLSAISCVDYIKENKFMLSYHLYSYEHKIVMDVNTKIDREKAEYETVIDIYYPARFFERDIYEFFGITFKGNDDMNKFVLTDWEGMPPMRKDFVTRDYANQTYEWRRYEPKWMKDFGLSPEDLEGEE